jgi:hypothetical protein
VRKAFSVDELTLSFPLYENEKKTYLNIFDSNTLTISMMI